MSRYAAETLVWIIGVYIAAAAAHRIIRAYHHKRTRGRRL